MKNAVRAPVSPNPNLLPKQKIVSSRSTMTLICVARGLTVRVGTKKQDKRHKQGGRRTKSKATTRSTAGVGFNFEDLVSAWLLVRMLSGLTIPGLDVAGIQLQTQTHAHGWDIDDQLISASADQGRLIISSKGSLKVTASGLPADFLLRALRQ
jgi:hypothetical protein